jgi:hypothetical protein
LANSFLQDHAVSSKPGRLHHPSHLAHGDRPREPEPLGTAFLRRLARRGLHGVKLMISDAHEKADAVQGQRPIVTDSLREDPPIRLPAAPALA